MNVTTIRELKDVADRLHMLWLQESKANQRAQVKGVGSVPVGAVGNPFEVHGQEQGPSGWEMEYRRLSDQLAKTLTELRDALADNARLKAKVERSHTMAAGLIDMLVSAYGDKQGGQK